LKQIDFERAKELKEDIARAEKDFDVITSPTDYRDNEKLIQSLAKELTRVLCKD
jgi:hypothetical protein